MSPQPTNGPKRIAIAIVERGSTVLIGLRPEGVPLAGYWEFPGGKVESRESFAETAVRECREETGLRVTTTDEYPATVHEYEHDTVHLRFFRCQLEAADLAKTPKAPFRWVEMSTLDRCKFPAANQDVVRQLARRQNHRQT